MNNDEFLSYLQSKTPEDRHITMCLNIGHAFGSAKRGKNLEYFEREYLRLKKYMKMHRWSKDFISSRFGVSFKAMTQLYFKCANS